MAGVNITYYTKNGAKTIKIINLPKIWMNNPDVSFIGKYRIAGLTEDLKTNTNYELDDLLDNELNGYNYTKTMNNTYNKELNKYKKWYSGQLTVEEEPIELPVGLNIADKLKTLPDNKYLDVSDLKNIKMVLSTKNKFAGNKSKLTSNNYKSFSVAICSIPNGSVRYAEDVRNAKNYFNIEQGQQNVCSVGSTMDVGVPVRTVRTFTKKEEPKKEPEKEPIKETMKEKMLRLKKEDTTKAIDEKESKKEIMKEKMIRLKKEKKDIDEETILEGVDIFDFDTYNKEFDLMKKYFDGLELYLRTALFIDYKYNHLSEKDRNIVEETLKKKTDKLEYIVSMFDVFEPLYLLSHWFNHFAPEKLKKNPNHPKELLQKYNIHIDVLFNRLYKFRIDKSWDEHHQLWFSNDETKNKEIEKEDEEESEEIIVKKGTRKTKAPVKEKKEKKERPFKLVLNTIGKNKLIDVSNIDKNGYGILVVNKEIYDGFYASTMDLPIVSDNYESYKKAIKMIDNGPIKYKRDLQKASVFFGLSYVDVSNPGDNEEGLKVIKVKDVTDKYYITGNIVSDNFENLYNFFERHDRLDKLDVEEAKTFFQTDQIDNFIVAVKNVSKGKVIDVSGIMDNYNVTEIRKGKVPKDYYVSINQPIVSNNINAFNYAISILEDKNELTIDLEQAALFFDNNYLDVSGKEPIIVSDDEVCEPCFISTTLRLVSDNYEGFYNYAKNKGYLALLEDDIKLAKEFFNESDSDSDQ